MRFAGSSLMKLSSWPFGGLTSALRRKSSNCAAALAAAADGAGGGAMIGWAWSGCAANDWLPDATRLCVAKLAVCGRELPGAALYAVEHAEADMSRICVCSEATRPRSEVISVESELMTELCSATISLRISSISLRSCDATELRTVSVAALMLGMSVLAMAVDRA